jgi:hypothetical protein
MDGIPVLFQGVVDNISDGVPGRSALFIKGLQGIFGIHAPPGIYFEELARP